MEKKSISKPENIDKHNLNLGKVEVILPQSYQK